MADPNFNPDERPEQPTGSPTPDESANGNNGAPPQKYEITFSHNGQVLYKFYADQFVMFEDKAITDPAILAKLPRPDR
jgi:hypothetical protein